MKFSEHCCGCDVEWRCCRREVDSPWSWLVCICATLVISLVLGTSLSFGVLFPVLMDYFQESRERTAWAGSVGLALTFALGPCTSALVNRFNCRITAFLGGVSCVVSLLLTSIAPSITVIYFTYSLLFGFGSSCLYMSCYVVTSQYFDKQRSLATGLLASGTGIGTLALPPTWQLLLDAFNWRESYRVMAGILSVICFLILTFDPSIKGKEGFTKDRGRLMEGQRRKKWLDFSVFKGKCFFVMTFSFSLAMLGHNVPKIHLVRFSEDLDVPGYAASKLFIYIGIAVFIGRLVAGCLCNMRWVNPYLVFMFGLALDGVISIELAQSTKYSHLVVFSVFNGLADGLVIGTFNIVLLYCVEPRKRASAFGLSALFYGVTAATGPPLAGFMTDHLGTYLPSFYMSAAVEFAAAILPVILVVDKTQPEGEVNQEQSQECVSEDQDERILYETSV